MKRIPLEILRPGLMAVLMAVLMVGLPSRPSAHEIPTDVTVQAFVKPEGQRLRLLVRVPLTSMRDVEFPLRGPGYLDTERLGSMLRNAARLWIADYVELREGDTPLGDGDIVAARLSLPSDRSFGSYPEALAHVTSPPTADTNLVPEQWLLDVLIEYPIQSADARFSIDPAWAHLGLQTVTVLRFLPPDGGERIFRYESNPGVVELDPRWHQAVLRFVELGFFHILGGLDHLLFIFCLVIPFRRFRGLIPVVTAFTVAHSITLIASAFGLAPNALWFPPLIETLIALSIVYMAFENIAGVRLQRRWLLAFGFGLVHGFGFSFLLRESLQFAGSHLLTSLLAFNVGVELGQLLVLLLAIPVLEWLFRHAVAERIGTILLSALIAHTAWHWMTERGSQLAQYDFQWPAADLALLASFMRWLMLLLILLGVAWLLSAWFGRLAQPDRKGDPAARSES